MLPSLSELTLRAEEEVVPTGVDTPIAKKEKKKKPLASSGARFSLPKSEDAPCAGLECAWLKLVVKPVRDAVNKLFANTNPEVLGSGVDNLAYRQYNTVVPVGVWQITYGRDHAQRNAYLARKAAMLLENKECNEYGPSRECVRTDKVLATVGDKLVGEAISPRLAERINEKYLVHGTNAGVLSSIIQSRFKPELSQAGRQAYGAGVYQAEDVGKADQYAKRTDDGADALDQTLNIRTLAEEVDPSLADLDTFYILVTRTLLGCANHVAHAEGGRSMEIIRDMTDKHAFERNPSLDARGLVSYQFRPPYDSLIKEHKDVIRGGFATGPKYREFLVQRADQVLPVMVVGLQARHGHARAAVRLPGAPVRPVGRRGRGAGRQQLEQLARQAEGRRAAAAGGDVGRRGDADQGGRRGPAVLARDGGGQRAAPGQRATDLGDGRARRAGRPCAVGVGA